MMEFGVVMKTDVVDGAMKIDRYFLLVGDEDVDSSSHAENRQI